MLQLEELLEYAENLDNDKKAKVSLLFITRELKPGMKASAKVLDKYDFELQKVSLSPEISKHFKDVLSNQIKSHSSRDEIEIKPYTVIDDDLENKIYTYALNNAVSFSKVITEYAKSDKLKTIKSLNDVRDKLWAYCIKVQSGGDFTYSFRKMGKSKITTNEAEGVIGKISARFDKSDGELRSFDGSVISFDDKIDCIYISDQFYVFKKKSFEAILGLEEEFKEVAQKTIETIKSFDMVEGLELIEDEITHKPSIRKTLSHIKEKGNDKTLSEEEVASMNEVLKKFRGVEFKLNDEGKIILANSADVKNFLQLLNDYYKQGMTTKKYYASDAGSLVSPQGN